MRKISIQQIHSISDLREHPDLGIGLTHEFLDRQDGWRPLAARYQLALLDVRGIDHALGYAALANGWTRITSRAMRHRRWTAFSDAIHGEVAV